MREIRWFFSFCLALGIHGVLLAGFFFWHTGFTRPIIYSPSFSVSLYSQVPQETRRARPKVIKKGKHRVVSKLPSKPPAPPPSKKEKGAWKVKKKKVSTKKKATKKVASKTPQKVSKKTRVSKKASLAREKALLARALAEVSKEVSAGGGGISRENVELKYKAYYDEIWRRVKASWILPEEVISSGEDFLAVVVVRIGRKGELLEMKLEKSSGNKLYDQSCLRAVKKAAPFPPLPKDYPQKYMELGLRFRPWG